MEIVTPAGDESFPRKKRSLKACGCGCLAAVLLLPVIALLLAVVIPIWVHNGKLNDFTQRFYDYPLPPMTRVEDSAQGSVALRGNGNHCDYLVRFALSTELSEEEIARYYEQANIPGVDGGHAYVRIYFPKRLSRFDGGWPVDFIIEILDSTGPGWDIRCH
ncbi:hypothetical protein [Microbispora sp. H13382]|uniref:hypothetical protein n=1 Tax=Microbispora sp. H13382 TaxID=2729112 RepID=UPI001601520B|nr:hypothetical protein [Microbispora sp. H13382]